MKSEKEKMLAGEFYSALDKELTGDRLRAKKLLQRLNTQDYGVTGETWRIIRELVPNAPADLCIEPPFHCDYGYNLFCGKRVFFNVNCVVLDVMKVTIGTHVMFGPGVHIYTASHPVAHKLRRKHQHAEPVTIGDDCWVGGGAIICPGVTIGKRCVIGAGSVVTRDIPNDSLAVGNPARVIRTLPH